MWLDFGNAIVNENNVDYICFEQIEEMWHATIAFSSGDSLNFEHADIDILKTHFKKVLGIENV